MCECALTLTINGVKHPFVRLSICVNRHGVQFTVSMGVCTGSECLYSRLNKSAAFVGLCDWSYI